MDRSIILSALTNRNAPKIDEHDILDAAVGLRVSEAHVRAIMRVETGGKRSFGPEGRPVILPEPHIFSRLTKRQFDASHPTISYRTWGKRPYPKTQAERYDMLVRMADLSFDNAFASASWGLFQIMGFHAKDLGYATPWEFARAMAKSEANHLDAFVRFIRVNRLDDELRACRPNDPKSCEAFAAGYNGRGFRANRYHQKLAKALGEFQ